MPSMIFTRVKRGFYCSLFVAMFAAVAVPASSQTPSASMGNPENNPRIPRVDAPVVLPALAAGKNEVLIAYKETNFGFPETFGFDTYVYRFFLDENSILDSVRIEERRLADVTKRRMIRFNMEDGGFNIDADKANGKTETLEVKRGGNFATIQPPYPANWRYEMDSAGDFAIMIADGSYVERYDTVPGEPFREVTILKNGVVQAKGRFVDCGEKGIIYTLRKPGDACGVEDLTIELWVDDKGDYRFRTSHVEPVNEVFVSGLDALLKKPHAFTNLMLIDIAFMLNSKDIRPILAFAMKRR